MFTPLGPNRYLVSALPNTGADIFPFLIGQTFLLNKSPAWATNIQRAASGRERATRLWSYPIWTFKLAFEVLSSEATQQDLQGLLGFFNLCGGKFSRWKYYDPTDNAVTGQPFGTGDGTTTVFQLVRSFTYQSTQWQEPVLAVRGTPVISINGTPTLAFTLTNTGQVTFTSAPANGASLTWTGGFYFLCRFDQDNLDVAQMFEKLWSVAGLQFCSVKP